MLEESCSWRHAYQNLYLIQGTIQYHTLRWDGFTATPHHWSVWCTVIWSDSSSGPIIVRTLSRMTTIGVCSSLRACEGAVSEMLSWYPRWSRQGRRRRTHLCPVNLDHVFIFFYLILNFHDFSASPQLQSLLASTFCNNWLSHLVVIDVILSFMYYIYNITYTIVILTFLTVQNQPMAK